MEEKTIKKRVALFDLDGVVFATENLYSVFWEDVFSRLLPVRRGLEKTIKGQTLTWIYEKYFPERPDLQREITLGLNHFEQEMPYFYVKGFLDFVQQLRRDGVKTAVVTSSNLRKMKQVYREHPDFESLFDRIITSEDFEHSKPDPSCYLLGASCFDAQPEECVAFEDSINGMKAVLAAGIPLVGLSTTLASEVMEAYTKVIIPNFEGQTFESLVKAL